MTGWCLKGENGIDWLERPGKSGSLVLLHGIGSNAASFAPLVDRLDPNLRVIAWDMPGYRGSAPLPKAAPVAQDYADALVTLVGAAGLDRFALLGHSLGALVAAAYARRNPDAVSRLILVSPALGHGARPGGHPGATAQARIDELELMGPKAFGAARAANLVHDPDSHSDVVAMVRDGMAQVQLAGYAPAARMLGYGRLVDDTASLTVVTDVVTGANDRVTPPDGARRLYNALPPQTRGTWVELHDTGHAVPQQNPAGLAAALSAILRPLRKETQ